MSAHKRALITPDSAALRRLDEISAQLRAATQPNPALLQAAQKQTQAEVRKATQKFHQRQVALTTHLESHLDGVDDHLFNLARRTESALEAQAQQLQALALESASQGNLTAQVEHLLDQQSAWYEDLLHQTQEVFHQDLDALAGSLQNQHRRSQAAIQAAAQALRQSQALLESLQKVYPRHPSFAVFSTRLEQAQSNLSQGFAEAAISTAQETAWQLHEAHLELEKDLTERSLLHSAASEKLASVQAWLIANEHVSAVDLDGRSLDYPLEVDFWTRGGWTQLVQTLSQLQEYLAAPAESLAKQDFLDLLHHTLPRIEQSIPDLVAEARRAVLASQLRFNMAEAVLTALGDQGFIPAEAAYENGDMRNAYQLEFHNLEGSELVVTLNPQPGGVKNQLDLVSKDYHQRTPHELRQRARELARSLNHFGLQVLNPSPHTLQEPAGIYATSQPSIPNLRRSSNRQVLPANRYH